MPPRGSGGSGSSHLKLPRPCKKMSSVRSGSRSSHGSAPTALCTGLSPPAQAPNKNNCADSVSERAAEDKDTLKIALLGAGSLQYFSSILGYALHTQGIRSKIYVGTYNGLELDIMDGQSEYHLFCPPPDCPAASRPG